MNEFSIIHSLILNDHQTHILLIFQRVKQFETAATTSNASFSQLGGPSNKAEQISKDEIQKWKQQVVYRIYINLVSAVASRGI